MNDNQHRTLTGVLLCLVPVLLVTANLRLSMTFDYPAILRRPVPEVLALFQANGNALIATWYVFMLGAILFIPLAVMLCGLLAREEVPLMAVTATIGVLAGIVQTLGLIRWVFLVPYLTQTYFDPASSQATRDAAVVVFQAFNQYAGVAVGEHLGYLFTGTWTLLVALALSRTSLCDSRLAWLGIVPAIGIVSGVLEPLGFGAAVALNALGYILWAVWAMLVGVSLLRNKTKRLAVQAAQN